MAKKRTSNKFSILIPVFLLVLAGLIFRAYQEYKASKLISLTRYTFINQNSLISINIKDKTKIIINLPEDLYVETAYHYGQLRLKNVYAVGQLDRRGGKVLAGTVSDLLGVPVLENNFNYLDQLLIRFHEFNLRVDKIKKIEVQTDELVLADGSKALTVDQNKWDFLTADVFNETDLVTENLKIEILNAGTVTGLGNQAARLLTRIGLDVVNVANQDIPIKDCEVKVVKPSKTAERIAGIFGCKIMAKEPGRADVSLILRVLHPGE
ncbi:MAG: LytR C-terminal domain-containing protein [Patescibacteria group bacterium]